MPRRARLEKVYHCQECGVRIPVRRAWRSGICVECAAQHMRDNIEQLQARSGPYYDRWLTQWTASLRAQLQEVEGDKQV